MRKAMQDSVRCLISRNENTALLLVDIGVWPFRDILEKYPNRAKNIGIFEPGTISVAAGLSLMGVTPVVYGITPFIVQRALEQIKLDFIYQKTGGNFITTGASYDFSTLGYSHYCPEDVATLLQLPGMDILTPGTPQQFSTLWDSCALNGKPSYFRLTDYSNETCVQVNYGQATVIRRGTKGTVIAVAETLDKVLVACEKLDVSILYYTTIQPFDAETLKENYHEKILVCEPFYENTMAPMIVSALKGCRLVLDSVGVPREVLRNYGTKLDKDRYCGLTIESIRSKAERFFN